MYPVNAPPRKSFPSRRDVPRLDPEAWHAAFWHTPLVTRFQARTCRHIRLREWDVLAGVFRRHKSLP
jgi:hypothetical protein